MKKYTLVGQLSVSLTTLFFFFILALPVNAATSVAPGHNYYESYPRYDGSKVECRKGANLFPEDELICDEIFYLAPPRVGLDKFPQVFTTVYSVPIIGTEPAINSAAIYKEFEIAASEIYPDQSAFVDVQISIVYDVTGTLDGKGAFYTEMGLSLKVEDVEDDLFVGGHELFERTKGGGQSVEDITVIDLDTMDVNDASSHFIIKLQRGHTYRIWFEAEALSMTEFLGYSSASLMATWKRLSVSVAEDEVEQLAIHDEDIKARLDLLEQKHEDLKAFTEKSTTETEEIKEKLENIKANQEEIIKLLKTPRGYRPGWGTEGYDPWKVFK